MRKFYLIPMALGALTLASCSDTIYDEPVQEEYSKDFIEKFGKIDAEQDWNVVEQKSVTVNPGSASEVQIYAKNGIAYKLVGDYKGLSGQQALTFDAAKTCDEFVVVAGGKGQVVNNGGSVNFGIASRSYQDNVANVFEKHGEYTEFTWEEVEEIFADRLPEGKDNRYVENAASNFDAIVTSDRVINVYPVYWNADYDHQLGIYWYDENGNKHEQLVYADKEDKEDDVQVYVTHRWVGGSSEGYEPVTWNRFDNPEGTWFSSANVDKSKPIRSTGFTIKLPVGTRFGFYIETEGKTFYSSTRLNENNTRQAIYTRLLNEESNLNRTYIGFEDMSTRTIGKNGSDGDMNDFILILDPAPLIIDQDALSWIIAAEDLGATGDYDFNDVVFSVEHVAGSTEATVTPLAAGGTLPAYITLNNVKLGPDGKQEIHEWIGINGQEAPSGFKYPMLNTETPGTPGESVKVKVDPAFTLAYNSDPKNMGGFSVLIEDITPRNVTAPGKGEAPQMICVPRTWKWPKEKIDIWDAYPEFNEYGEGYQEGLFWYNYPADNAEVISQTQE